MVPDADQTLPPARKTGTDHDFLLHIITRIENVVCPFAVTTSCSSGFKSRPRSCPYTLVAQESGVVVTRGRKFSIGKVAGRNESELVCSLVKQSGEADPMVRRGRPLDVC